MVLLGEAQCEGSAMTNTDIKLPSYHYLDVFNNLLVHNNNKFQPPETKEAYTHI